MAGLARQSGGMHGFLFCTVILVLFTSRTEGQNTNNGGGQPYNLDPSFVQNPFRNPVNRLPSAPLGIPPPGNFPAQYHVNSATAAAASQGTRQPSPVNNNNNNYYYPAANPNSQPPYQPPYNPPPTPSPMYNQYPQANPAQNYNPSSAQGYNQYHNPNPAPGYNQYGYQAYPTPAPVTTTVRPTPPPPPPIARPSSSRGAGEEYEAEDGGQRGTANSYYSQVPAQAPVQYHWRYGNSGSSFQSRGAGLLEQLRPVRQYGYRYRQPQRRPNYMNSLASFPLLYMAAGGF